MSTSIYVKSHDFGFWTECPITVQRFYKDELIYCNHAGAEEEAAIRDYWNPGTDSHTTHSEKYLVCDKCGQYSFDKGESWEV